ncbi:hypothetical protein K491DRAFT_588344 [Lophiostoma macrostomum CBS 122681]|uniref:F-box domain-containing protein n=1 Tax=Lophiostoma macrostomum CBS 122681 TaxID=1314788 RepID=A0A6A6TN65_9PLEO|nr:hypothetical protein K491DRAFT_588344 [Lophiostoma macrostomum CBS 122681]
MARFTELPVELVEHIMAYCRQSELYSLTRVSRAHYTLAASYLYEHVDLRIRFNKVPRIDTFYFSVSGNSARAMRVKTLRLGLSPEKGVKDGQHILPKTSATRQKQFDQAVEMLIAENAWIEKSIDLKDAMCRRCYGAFACLLLFSIPDLRLRCLELADHENETLHPLPRILYVIIHGSTVGQANTTTPLLEHLSSIEDVVQSFDGDTGVQHSDDRSRVLLPAIYRLPGLRKLELFVPTSRASNVLLHSQLLGVREMNDFSRTGPTTFITNVTIRHTKRLIKCLQQILIATPHLISLTCEMWNDCSGNKVPQGDFMQAARFRSALRLVKDTLQVLTISVEYCDSTKGFYHQPYIGEEFPAPHDYTDFGRLHTLEAPLPFITGDQSFSIFSLSTETNIARRLPPNLRHLSLRTDMSRAQFVYPPSKTEELDLLNSTHEAEYLMGARMDLSYIYQATLLLLDHAIDLQSITVWEPPDPSLNWPEDRLGDFETTCRNKMILGRMIYPQMVRLRHQKHWNLIKEVTLFDPCMPDRTHFEQYARGERTDGVPLGLATQYHISRFLNGQVERIY